MPPAELVVRRAATDPVTRGHPWIWQGAVLRTEAKACGEEVSIVSQEGQKLGRGIFDPESPIAARVWTRDETPVDAALFRARALHAVALRDRLFADGKTTAYRLVHGEGDRMPGIVVDRYAHVAVLRADGDAAGILAKRFGGALAEVFQGAGIRTLVVRTSPRGGEVRLETLAGEPPPDVLEVREHDIPFVVDLARGQKTGAFLDQREN
jgi:23S rRNA (cytosine1962-C5)-methyltransferase